MDAYILIPVGDQFAIVDPDSPALSFTWHLCRGYAVRRWRENGKRKAQYMHQLISGIKGADHKNNNKLDNRRVNLRPATNKQNMANMFKRKNTSGRKGVHFCKRTQKWHAQIRIAGKKTFLGRYSSLEEASRVYDKAEIKEFGEFAWASYKSLAKTELHEAI